VSASKTNSERTHKLILAASLESCEIGAEYDHLPPHLTIVPPFYLHEDVLPELHEGMAERMIENPKMQIVGGETTSYGVGEEVCVRQLGGRMFGLHAAAIVFVRYLGGEFDETYTGLEWHPHLSSVSALAQDERRELTEVQLFRYLPLRLKRVSAIYSAQGVTLDEEA